MWRLSTTRTALPQPDDSRTRFDAVFEAWHRRVFAYCLRRAASPENAEDATAETFVVAWRRISSVPTAEDAVLPWLLAVARRVLANQYRGARRASGLLERLRGTASDVPGPVPTSPAAEALTRLRAEDQELLRLLAWDGLSQAEAGAVLGISANAVAIRLHRARKRFAEELAKGSEVVRTLPLMKGDPRREHTT